MSCRLRTARTARKANGFRLSQSFCGTDSRYPRAAPFITYGKSSTLHIMRPLSSCASANCSRCSRTMVDNSAKGRLEKKKKSLARKEYPFKLCLFKHEKAWLKPAWQKWSQNLPEWMLIQVTTMNLCGMPAPGGIFASTNRGQPPQRLELRSAA